MYWTTKDGKEIDIGDLETSHLINIIKMLVKNVAYKLQAHEPIYYCEYGSISMCDDDIYYECYPVYADNINVALGMFAEWDGLRAELTKRLGSHEFLELCNKYLVSLGYDYEVDEVQ